MSADSSEPNRARNIPLQSLHETDEGDDSANRSGASLLSTSVSDHSFLIADPRCC